MAANAQDVPATHAASSPDAASSAGQADRQTGTSSLKGVVRSMIRSYGQLDAPKPPFHPRKLVVLAMVASDRDVFTHQQIFEEIHRRFSAYGEKADQVRSRNYLPSNWYVPDAVVTRFSDIFKEYVLPLVHVPGGPEDLCSDEYLCNECGSY